MNDLLKKIVFKNSRNLNLTGNLFDIGSNKIVIMAHGFTNNKSSNGRYDKLAEALNSLGYDALAFDFSGCGESDDDVITASNQCDDLNSAIKEQLKKLDTDGFFFVNFPSGKIFKITKQTLLDFEQINQKELMSKVSCPVLIIHGDNIEDEEEIQLLERSKQAMQYLPATSRLEVITGGKHGLRGEWATVISLACKWYKKHCN